MAVPSFLRTSDSDIFGSSMLPVLEELFYTEFTQRPQQREMLFRVVNTDRDIWQYSELHDMPTFSSVAEGSDYSFSSPKKGNNKTITPVKYGLGYSISEEAVDDGKFDLIADAMRKMGESARESQEQAAMNILNNGFSSQTTPDGQALFASSHTTPSGNITFRNTLATNADLSYTALQTAIQDFGKQFRGDSGIYKQIRPKFLVVPDEMRLYAQELVGSDGKADSADNNMNSLKGEGLQVVSSPRLTSAIGWFILSDPRDHGLRLIKRKALETKAAAPDSVGFLNDAILYKARYREQLDCVHAYGAFGVQGV